MFGASSIHSKFDKYKALSNCPKVDCSKKCPIIPIPDCINECNCPEIEDSSGRDDQICLAKIKEIEILKTQIEYLQNKMENTKNMSIEDDKCKSCPKCLISEDDCSTSKTSPIPQLIIPDDKPCPKPCDCKEKNDTSDDNNSNCPKCECLEKLCDCKNNNMKSDTKKYLPPPCPNIKLQCPSCDSDQKKCPICESCEIQDSSPRPFKLPTSYMPRIVR